MSKKIKIYEAGGMSGLDLDTMNNWRLKATELLKSYSDNIHTINPVEYYNFSMSKENYTEHEVKFFDLYQVKNCDLVLVNLDLSINSIGTAIELHEAHDNWHIPVIGYGEKEIHPWMELSLTKRVKTLEEAVEHIIEYYLVNM